MAVESTESQPVLDIEGTLARFDGDKQLFAEMAAIMLEDVPPHMGELRRALATNNAVATRHHAHAVKGLLSGCGGLRAAHLAQTLENAGQSGQWTDCPATVESLESEFVQLQAALRNFLS